jgi:hypothetical protein
MTVGTTKGLRAFCFFTSSSPNPRVVARRSGLASPVDSFPQVSDPSRRTGRRL